MFFIFLRWLISIFDFKALPKLRIERDNGYIHREEAKYNLEQASRFIVEHRYQKAFFKRSYEVCACSNK
jgi:hypothetical protein